SPIIFITINPTTASYHSTVPNNSSTFPAKTNENKRTKWLDSYISGLLVLELMVSGLIFGGMVSVSAHHGGINYIGDDTLGLVHEVLMGLIWIIALVWLNLVVRKSPNATNIGRGFQTLYLLTFISRTLQLHANSSSSKTQPLNPLNATFSTDHDNETFFITIVSRNSSKILANPIISPIRNTNSRRRAARMAEMQHNVHVNTEEGVASEDTEDEDDIDNPDDESSPNFVREPCRYQDASLFSKLTFSWIDALLFKGYRAPLESEDFWDLDEKDKTHVTLRRWGPFKRSSQTLFYSLLDFFKFRLIVSYTISFLSVVLDLGRPYFLFYLLQYLETGTGTDPNENSRGVLLLLSLLATLLLKAMRRAAGSVKSKIYGFFYHSHFYIIQLPLTAALSVFALFWKGSVADESSRTIGVNEFTPLLGTGGDASANVDAVVNVSDRNDKLNVQLPEAFGTPVVGTYKAEFEYYGSSQDKSKSVKPVTSKSKFAIAVGFVVESYSRVKGLFVKKADAGDISREANAKPAAVVKDDVLPFELRDITARFPFGGLTTIVGPTGSGKTSMLLALLGEMKRKQGFCFFPDPRLKNPSVAYAAQTAFILNATVRENILFGCEFDEARYNQVIEAYYEKDLQGKQKFEKRRTTALVRVLEILEGGDMTEIGEKGINLSGGQKQRISLARAAYSNAQVVLLDDCLSAVDAPTARHLLRKCILGLLMSGRTCILVTHATYLVLPYSQHIIAMKNGSIEAQGTLEEIMASPDVDIAGITKEEFNDEDTIAETDLANDEKSELKNKESLIKATKRKATKVVKVEEMSRGFVKVSVYLAYVKACGWALGILWITLQIATYFSSFQSNGIDAPPPQAFTIQNTTSSTHHATKSISVALTSFITQPSLSVEPTIITLPSYNITTSSPFTTSTIQEPTTGTTSALYFIGIYAVLSLISLIIGLTGEFSYLNMTLHASRVMHSKLLNGVLGSPMRFFERTPVGRLLNRFTTDMSTVDSDCGSSAFIYIFIIISVIPGSWIFLPILTISYIWVATIYNITSRQLKRLESITNSPIYAQFSETLNGISTIRAYGCESRNTFYLWTVYRWLNIRCGVMSALFSAGVALGIVVANVSPGWAGLTLTYAFELTAGFTWVIRAHATMDMSMNAVERVDEYSNLEQEPPAIVKTYPPPPSKLKTSPIHPSEKIGVVGRTGAGKSTLTMAFFRILEDIEGSIIIDDMDIFKMGLKGLRSKLTIIPQDPVLFEGTLRFNLDPVGIHTDEQM
ncbi:hypothetical protein HDU76_003588, partial [Blyttiomyces sp. JEL0837]